MEVTFVLNARTDVYLAVVGSEETRFERTVERLRHIASWSGLCFCAWHNGLETITKLVKAVEAPLNVLATPACPPVAELEKRRGASEHRFGHHAGGDGRGAARGQRDDRRAKLPIHVRGATPYIDLKRNDDAAELAAND